MIATSRRILGSAAALVLCLSLASPAAATPTPTLSAPAPLTGTVSTLEDATGLRVTITTLRPAALKVGKPLRMSGVVTNTGNKPWRDAQVYLDVDGTPATTKTGLDAFGSGEPFGDRITTIGLFDQIGAVLPGTSKPYTLTIPYADLQLSGDVGIYHVGVSVLAQIGPERDLDADARTDTVITLLPQPTGNLKRTGVLTLVPMTGAVLRRADGTFLDEELAGELSFGGRLRNLLDFALQAPRDSLQIALDPALRDAIEDMGDGYDVQSIIDAIDEVPAHDGGGQVDARLWLADLVDVVARQHVLLLPWGTPDVVSLARNRLPAVVDAAVLASASYAADNRLDGSILGWPVDGASGRRSLSIIHQAGARTQVVAQRSLPDLGADPAAYPPPQVTITTRNGPLTALVTRSDVGGRQITASTTAVEFRQALMAEATVRSLSGTERDPLSVIAAPFDWDPGTSSDTADLASGFRYPTVSPRSVAAATEHASVSYAGSVTPGRARPVLSDGIIRALIRLREQGSTLTGLLTDRGDAVSEFTGALAMAGSSTWWDNPARGTALIHRQAKLATEQLAKVTVTGPTFVALSSDSGRFPLTVTNGLDVPVTVEVHVRPRNPALKVDPIDPIELAPGQHRDVLIHSHADGSGLTPVRVRLSTSSGRPFGDPWDFDVRATQIGVAIWIIMGVGLAILFGAAGLRIARRMRSPSALAPREEPMH